MWSYQMLRLHVFLSFRRTFNAFLTFFSFSFTSCRVEELELNASAMNEMETKLKEMETKLKTAISQSVKALAEKELAENSLSSIEYEFDLAKTKFKAKERELIDTLDEARNESKSRGGENVAEKFFALEETLKKVEAVSYIF